MKKMKNVSAENLKASIERIYGKEYPVEILDGEVYFCEDLVPEINLNAYGLCLSNDEPQISQNELDQIIDSMGPELTNPVG